MPPPPPTPLHRTRGVVHRSLAPRPVDDCGEGEDAPLYRSLTIHEVEALECVPEYRSLGASDEPAPAYRSLAKSHVAEVDGDLPEPAYRSVGASVRLPAAPAAVPKKRDPNASKNRLLRLASA